MRRFERLDAILRPEAGTRLQHVLDLDHRRWVARSSESAPTLSRRAFLLAGLAHAPRRGHRSGSTPIRRSPTKSETLAGVGKTPIRVKDVVGFAVNRLLHAMVIESIRLVEEGVCSPADIDSACKLGLGHPIGPFELWTTRPIRCPRASTKSFIKAYGERFLPRPLLRQMVAAGYDGRKAGRGWHRYDKDGKRL